MGTKNKFKDHDALPILEKVVQHENLHDMKKQKNFDSLLFYQ